MGQRKKDSNFDKLVDYINCQEDGTVILRSDLLYTVYGRSAYISRSTVDKWRRQLTVCEYLGETAFPGQYIKLVHIPGDLTSSELEQKANTELSAWYRRHYPGQYGY